MGFSFFTEVGDENSAHVASINPVFFFLTRLLFTTLISTYNLTIKLIIVSAQEKLVPHGLVSNFEEDVLYMTFVSFYRHETFQHMIILIYHTATSS